MPTAHARTEAAPREGGGGQVSLVTRAQEVAEDLKPSSVVQREDGAGGDWRPWQSRICPSTGTTTLRCRGGAQLRIIKVKTSKKNKHVEGAGTWQLMDGATSRCFFLTQGKGRSVQTSPTQQCVWSPRPLAAVDQMADGLLSPPDLGGARPGPPSP